MGLFLTTVFVFAFVIFIMAIGVILSNRRIEGSCGGAGGCDFCLLKNKKNCDGNSAREEEATQSGEGKLDVCADPFLAEENLGDAGK